MRRPGQDGTDEFEDLHHSQDARKQLTEFLKGEIKVRSLCVHIGINERFCVSFCAHGAGL